MTDQNKAILAPLIYYDLLDQPLTAIETFKYLWAKTPEISFFDVWRNLNKANELKKFIDQKNGLYFLQGRQELIATRQKRLKLAQIKWKQLKKIGKYLTLVPFLQLTAVTGSLTSYNTKEQSDFDLLVTIKKERLWISRVLLTGLIEALGKRRHGCLTKNRICLNCYLTEDNLEITSQAKHRDFHSAQEYGRLTPVLEIKKGIYKNFIQANAWLANFLKNYPWRNSHGAKKIKPPIILSALRQAFEWLLGGLIGNWLEKISGRWQNKRINKKRQNEQTSQDQIFVSNNCLMFHPQSKSDKLMKDFNLKMGNLN